MKKNKAVRMAKAPIVTPMPMPALAPGVRVLVLVLLLLVSVVLVSVVLPLAGCDIAAVFAAASTAEEDVEDVEDEDVGTALPIELVAARPHVCGPAAWLCKRANSEL